MKIYWNGKSKNLIGKQVKKLRKENGWTQKVLAERMQLLGYEMSDLTILRVEQGSRFVPDYEVLGFAKVLGVSVEKLLTED